jgi:Protein of unknown function (DUF1566)/S-layer homology domain
MLNAQHKINNVFVKSFFDEMIPMTPNSNLYKLTKINAAIGALLLAFCHSAQADVKTLLATDPIIQKLKLFDNINASSFSRADATVLLDRLLIFTVPSFNKNMDTYLNPFGDVNSNSDAYTSLMHLAYYRGNDAETAVTRANNLFRPLDYVTRQEFLKMAMQGFNIPVSNTNNLASFNDEQNIAAWAVKYFSTAVTQGIIVGDAAGNLNPNQNLTTYEALLILDRIVAKYDKAYLHNGAGFEAFTAVNLDKVLANAIGIEREPLNYINTATPINISNIVVETPTAGRCGVGAKVLRAVSTVDTATGKAVPYYWWSTSNGYLGRYQDAVGETAGASLQKVCFYPATTAVTNYRVTANGSDNIGFSDSYQKTLAASTFAVTNSPLNTTTMALSVVSPTSLTAGKIAVLDLTGSQVKEGAVNVALEQVDVTFTVGAQTISLFSGNPEGNKIIFAVPMLESLYGKTGTLTVSAHTQTATQSKVFSGVRYLPKFSIKGQVFNTTLGTAATSVKIGTSTINLDEHNEFSLELVGNLNNQTLNIDVLGGDMQNSFTRYPIKLTYQSPVAYVAMIGENGLTKDSDADGMYDIWETQYGLNINDATDAAVDLDKDGFTNLVEFNGGSNPNDATSKPLVIKATLGDKFVTLKWAAITGASSYRVCYAKQAIVDINQCLSYAGGAWLNTTSATLKISNLTNGTKYYFRALAADVNGTLRVSSAIGAIPKALSALNDTGITTCSDATQNNLPCPVAGFPGQDGEYGRDKTLNNNADGHAGFNFTKISNTGAVLAASATSWNCVKDNVTGLMWEVKTDDSGLHDKDWTYSWYEPDNSKNGGAVGYQNNGYCSGSSCDTEAYVDAVNAAGWCGFKDWRMSSKEELRSIVDYSRYNPTIDTAYFLNTQGSYYWSSSPVADSSSGAWFVHFGNGGGNWDYKNSRLYVRLVRGVQ